MFTIRCIMLRIAVLLLIALPAAAQDQKSLDALLSVIRPGEGEDPFATIPWQTNLWDARTLAAKEGKPLLLWEMDGHPLGCG